MTNLLQRGATTNLLYRVCAAFCEMGFKLDVCENGFRDAMVQAALSQTDGNKTRAAALLGVHRNSLQRMLDDQQARQRRYERQYDMQPVGKVKVGAGLRDNNGRSDEKE